MNQELWLIVVPSLTGILFALGGTGNWPLASKLWRRLGVPMVIGTFLFFQGVVLWAVLAIAVALLASLSMGYGEGKTYLDRLFVAICWVIPSIFLGWTWWQLITPLAWIVMFWASNNERLKDSMRWKFVELTIGLLIGITYVSLLLK